VDRVVDPFAPGSLQVHFISAPATESGDHLKIGTPS
jgi:hypothetical protein